MFRTYEPARDRLVAVKAIRLDLTPEQARALAVELQRVADAGLDHPSIVRPLAAGVEGTVAYAAAEYVAAESLDVAMRHYAPATLDKALPFITQLAGAIDYARTAGVGHGALHPRDIFVTPEEARATGFGVVQAVERLGLRAPVRRPYTAPERVDGGEWDVRADVYSLAAIAFELITGRRPLGADPGSLGPTAGPYEEAVAVVLTRALADAPGSRYDSALAFAAALEAASRGDRTTGAIAQVRAIEEAPAGARALVVEREEDAHILDEYRDEDVAVERDEDLADIQLREEEAVKGETARAEAARADAARGEPATDEPARDETGPGEAVLAELARGETARRDVAEPAGEPAAAAPPERADAGADEDATAATGAGEWHDRGDNLGVAAGAAAAASAGAYASARDDADRFRETPADQSPLLFADDRDTENVIPEVQHPQLSPQPPSPARVRVDRAGPFEPEPVEPFAREPVARFEEGEPLRPRPRPGPPLLPAAAILLLGLFVGFLGGYLVGSRERAAPQSEEATATQPAVEETASPTPPTAVPPAADRPAPASPEVREPARQQAAETPPAAATRGRLVVRSIPAGAQVFVNGRRRGTTPLAIQSLDAGTYTVRLTRTGYQEQSRRVAMSGDGRDVTFRLARQPARRAAAPSRAPQPGGQAAAPAQGTFAGSLYVDSRPRGARVLLDGRAIGVTPVQVGGIRAGSHVVRIELAGHRAWSTSTSVVAGQVARVTASLERQR